jgi:hypothetical protein
LNEAIRIAEQPSWKRLQWARQFDPRPEPTSVAIYFSGIISGSKAAERLFRIAAFIQARVELLRTAVAAARFAREHHRLPARLEELVPAFLDSVPIDPFTGEPLKCKAREDHSWVIYSAGGDLKDDGGLQSQTGPSDIVVAF